VLGTRTAVVGREARTFITFRARPLLPEIHHDILQVLEPQDLLIQLLTIKCLAEAPARSPTSFSSAVHGARRVALGQPRQDPTERSPFAASRAPFTSSRKTWLCSEVRAEPQKGTAMSMKSGYWVVHWYVWPAPMDQPRTARACVMPRCCVTRACWARTLS